LFLWQLQLGEQAASLGVDEELGVGLDGHLDLAGWVGCGQTGRLVGTLVAVAGEALLADALAGLLVAGGGEAALGDVVAGGQDAVTHLVLEWFAEASALLGGGALLALGLVGGTPGTLQALGVVEAGVAEGGEGPLVVLDARAAFLGLGSLAVLVHGESTLLASLLALGTVAAGQVPPAGLTKDWLALNHHCVLGKLLRVDLVSWARRGFGFAGFLGRFLRRFLGRFLLSPLHNLQNQDNQQDQE